MSKEKVKDFQPETDPNFWYDLEHDSNQILKWNESGNYDKVFTTEEQNFLEKLHDLPEIQNVNVGDIVSGKISNISKREIIININYKDSIYVDVKANDLKIVQNLEKGEEINVMITSTKETPHYEIKGSITELIKMDVANLLKEHYKEKKPLIAHVKESIPAGFMLDIEMKNINITAFMPNTLAGVNRLTEAQSNDLLGKDIYVMLETLQQEKGVYVVSRKKYLRSLIPEAIQQLKEDRKLDEPKVYTGTVTGSKDFGVFIEFNECLTTMIHKVNIHEEWRDRLTEIIPGTQIDFYVRDLLKGDKIIATQILRESLWDTIRVGQVKEGIVRKVANFGVLVSLDDETTGLIQRTYIERHNKTLNKGDKVNVKIVSVIKDDRKIYLDFPNEK